LHKVLDDFRPDIVVFEEPWLYPYLSIVQETECTIVFDAHNVEATLRREVRTAGSHSIGWRTRLDLWSIRNIERSLVGEADQVWICSTQDAESMRSLYDPASTRVIPNTLDASNYAAVREQQPCDDRVRPVLTFIGSFGYGPNRRAAHALLKEVFPRVQEECSESRLLLVGNSPTSYMREQAEENPSVVVTGFVDDIRSFLAETDIVVIPLTEGSGTRLKVIEAFASKLPVVSTRKGVEGLDVEHEESVLIADTPRSMADQILALTINSKLRKKVANNAYNIMSKKYSWKVAHRKIIDAIENVHLSNSH
jgi:glycosyltransferase involved in cell wall biosynthesis